jgi:hypothetical protein
VQDLSQWSRARVNIDYHIAFDTNYYSVPLAGQPTGSERLEKLGPKLFEPRAWHPAFS